ncbi:MAG: P-loop NTPase [Thermoprotei archaeon]
MNVTLSEQEVLRVLRGVRDPEIGENIVDLNMVKEIHVDPKESRVQMLVALTVPECPLTEKIKSEVSSALSQMGAKHVDVRFTSMTESERSAVVEKVRALRMERIREAKSGTGAKAPGGAVSPISRLDKGSVHNIIAVVSGKGGVGKSSVAALIACELRRRNFRVGILDADVTGPSIPRLFGLQGRLTTDGRKMLPADTRSGIKVVSMNLIVERETDATVWRGPIINGIIRQFFTDVDWGELDYLVLDLPPGTSDAPLTVFQSIPLDGVVVVTSTQKLSRMIVQKAVNMAKSLNIPVLGLVENMVYTVCPHCQHKIVFSKSESDSEGLEGLKVLARLPYDTDLTYLSDEGRIEEYGSKEVSGLVDRIGSARVDALRLKIV